MSAAERIKENNASLKRSFLLAAITGGVLSALVVLCALVIGDQRDLNGALIGLVMSLVVILPSLASAWWGLKGSFTTVVAVVLGSWLAKMAVLIVILLLVNNEPWLHLRWAGIALLAGAVIPTLMEAVLLMKVRTRLEV